MDPGFMVNRAREMELLERTWRRGKGGLIVVYGRRRIGKTRLVLEWIRDKPHAYYQAGLWGHDANVKGLGLAIEEQLGVEGASGIASLKALLRITARFLDRAVIVVDEFTYWARAAPAVLGDLQWVADHVLPGSGLFLVLTGSIVGVVERGILGGGAPLYGRAMLRLRLGELEPWCLPFFAPGYGPEDLVLLYSLMGGIPHYLRLVDDSRSPLEAWLELFGPGGVLEGEPLYILRDEVRDPHPYMALLASLAVHEPTTLGKAAREAGIPAGHASVYARRLQTLGLVEPVPILFSRRRLYRVADKLVRASLTLLSPETPPIPGPRAGEALRRRMSRLVSLAWEELAARHATTVLAHRLGITPHVAGKPMHRGVELDWAVVDEEGHRILLVEAKWSRLTRGEALREARRATARLQEVLPGDKKHYEVHAAVYAREIAGGQSGGGKGATLITPGDLPWRAGCDHSGPAK